MTREEWATQAIRNFIAQFPEKGVTIICHQEDEGEDKILICMTSGANLEKREFDLKRILTEPPKSTELVDGVTWEVVRNESGLTHFGKRKRDS